MRHIQLQALEVEFYEGQNTIWIHGPHGTILRIKCTGSIGVDTCAQSSGDAHADVLVQGDIKICVPDGALHRTQNHPDYEYAVTETARKSTDDGHLEGDGWEPNLYVERNWERCEFHAENYWMRRREVSR